MARGRGHRDNLEMVGHELNLVPYLDVMVNVVMFLLVTITSFVGFTVLNASIPTLAPDAGKAVKTMKKAQLLLMVRITKGGFRVDPSIQGGSAMKRQIIPKKEGEYDQESLNALATELKQKFPGESRVLLIGEPLVLYNDIIKTMDALRETEAGKGDLFPDVTLSVL